MNRADIDSWENFRSGSYTFAIIKPEFYRTARFYIHDIILENRFYIYDNDIRKLDKKDVFFLYRHLVSKPEIFDPLLEYMTSDICELLILKKQNAVDEWRKLIGCTDSSQADPQSIRGRYGDKKVIRRNVVHGSDDAQHALEEILYFFYGV